MSGYLSPEHHPALEEYCETIFELQEEGVEVIQARIAERMAISRPAVSEMIKRLSGEGLVKVNGGVVTLTQQGSELASVVVRRHRLAERMLTDILGLSWAQSHHEAGKWEHVISPLVEKAIIEKLGDPKTCPHGNPVPGSGYVHPEGLAPLADFDRGDFVVVTQITEELEVSADILETLEALGVVPGAQLKIEDVAAEVSAIVADESIRLSMFVAERLLVVPASVEN